MATPPPSPQSPRPPTTGELAGALDDVGTLVRGIRSDQWAAPTPCADWNVRDVLAHVVGMNLVFAAMLSDRKPPERARDPLGEDPVAAYIESASALLAAFGRPGVLERVYTSPLGEATGADRLQIRLYDLLAHGWDLAQATSQAFSASEELAGKSLLFARAQLHDQARDGRFDAPQPVPDDAPALIRLVAFLGRPVGGGAAG